VKKRKAPAKASSKHDGKAKSEEGLTAMQELFVKEYLVDMNATQAAIRAKYSEHTAEQLGYQLLQNPSVRAAIDEQLRRRFERLDIRADKVLRELGRLAFGSLRDIAKWEGSSPSLIDSDELGDDAAALLKSINFSESESSSDKGSASSRTLSFTMHDKAKALELLARHFKMLTDKVEVDLSEGLAARLARARKRKESKA
jgi:phage terminase small subunit